MDRTRAKSWTIKAQLLALLFGAGAVAVGMGLVIPPGTPVADLPVSKQPVKADVKPTDTVAIDPTALASALDVMAPEVKPKDPLPDTDTAPPAPPPPATAWRYLGPILSGTYKRAVVIVNDKQHLAAEGKTIEHDEVLEIAPGYVKIKTASGEEQTVPLEARRRTEVRIAAPTGTAHPPGMSLPFDTRGVDGATRLRAASSLGRMSRDEKQKEIIRLKGMSAEQMKAEGIESVEAVIESVDSGKGGK